MEPWFAPWMGGVFGAAFGVLGGIYGTVVGICAPRGIARTAIVGFHFACLAVSIAFVIAAFVAWSSGQPYSVWYGLGLPGLLGTILFAAFTPMVFIRYRQAEEWKMKAADLSGS